MYCKEKGVCALPLSAAALCLIFLLQAVALTQDAGTASTDSEPSIKERKEQWEHLSDTKKKEIRKNFKYFKSLSIEERQRLRERHKKLKMIRENLDESETGNPEAISRPDKNSEDIYGRVKNFLKECEDELWQKLKPASDAEGDDPCRKVQRLRRHLEEMNLDRMRDYLERLVNRGVISMEEAEKIKDLPRDKKRDQLFRLGKDMILQEMEGWLPPAEERRWRGMDPMHFHGKLHRERERGRLFMPLEGLGRLTPEQEKTVQGMPQSPARRDQVRRFMEENIRARLEKAGVAADLIDRMMSLPPHERMQQVMKKIRSLKDEGKNLPSEMQDLLDEHKEHLSHDKQRDKERPQERGRRRQGNQRFM
ncbi:MAG: DUF3106 domain-containing protein [Planctomycetota bacterium]